MYSKIYHCDRCDHESEWFVGDKVTSCGWCATGIMRPMLEIDNNRRLAQWKIKRVLQKAHETTNLSDVQLVLLTSDIMEEIKDLIKGD